jgi:Uma2 family endonuclease
VDQPVVLPVYRFSVEEYHRLLDAGVLHAADRVELLEGWIISKMTHNPPHDGAVTRLHRRLLRLVPGDLLIRVQCALATRDSEPEPDVVMVPGPEDRYDARHPRPRDVLLLAEVSDRTLGVDQGIKLRLYARSRIQLYWILNLIHGRVEVYTEPRGGRTPAYGKRQDYGPGDSVPLVIGGKRLGTIPVRQLLP